MTHRNSNRTLPPEKPSKPYPDFPLSATDNGQECQKFKGNVWLFGKRNVPAASLVRSLDQKNTFLLPAGIRAGVLA